jgi:hypothetical protein
MPTYSNDKSENEAWSYSRSRAAYISGEIGEHTFRAELEILGLRGQDIEVEINCAKGEKR